MPEKPQPNVPPKETLNGPTVANEEALLRKMFGEPDEDGFYYGTHAGEDNPHGDS